jgi:soluble lytic murein transglycosylase
MDTRELSQLCLRPQPDRTQHGCATGPTCCGNAYLIARDAALPSRDIYKIEQEFTASWIALRLLKYPAVAAQHFARIGVGSADPTVLARAGYWQGSTAEAAGRQQEARAAYGRPAEQPTSYFGQLACAKLGMPALELNGVPAGRGLPFDHYA